MIAERALLPVVRQSAELQHLIDQRTAHVLSRMTLLRTVIGTLLSRERVASLFNEMAARVDRPVNGTVIFRPPLEGGPATSRAPL